MCYLHAERPLAGRQHGKWEEEASRYGLVTLVSTDSVSIKKTHQLSVNTASVGE